MTMTPAQCYAAIERRDRRFDGRFFTAVKTTGIYCRPICPARTPKAANVEFFAFPAAAEAAGYRPCLRCRPETAPGTPAWLGTSAIVGRALRLIDQGALDGADIEALAGRVGVSGRHLRRLFRLHVRTTPQAVAQARRTHFALRLLRDTRLPITRIAFDAGFSSVRQFNHAIRQTYRQAPRFIRRDHPVAATEDLQLRLPYRPPFDWEALLSFLRLRAIPGIEAVGSDHYTRSLRHGELSGTLRVDHDAAAHALILRVPVWANLLDVVQRIRRLFDLDADPLAIGEHLAQSPLLRPLVRRSPGLRVPGAWDGFELCVRAILGQQVSVRGATTLAGRLVERWGIPITPSGELTHIFPAPSALAEVDVSAIGLPRQRGATIQHLARAMAAGSLRLDATRDLESIIETLCALPGIGPWTANYIAMRACGEPDAFPAGDLGIRHALGDASLSEKQVIEISEPWRPWRAYAALQLWTSLSNPPKED